MKTSTGSLGPPKKIALLPTEKHRETQRDTERGGGRAEREGERERVRDRQTDRQTDRRTDRRTAVDTETQMHRETQVAVLPAVAAFMVVRPALRHCTPREATRSGSQRERERDTERERHCALHSFV